MGNYNPPPSNFNFSHRYTPPPGGAAFGQNQIAARAQRNAFAQQEQAQQRRNAFNETLANAQATGQDPYQALTAKGFGQEAMELQAKSGARNKWALAEVGTPDGRKQRVAYLQSDPSKTMMLGKPYGEPNTSMTESDQTAPWRNVIDPKERDKAKVKYGMEADETLKGLSEDATKAANMNQSLDRFVELNKRNYTGAGMSIPGVQGLRGTYDAEFQEMKSISDKLTPGMRQGMPGAASDRDVAMFKSATVGVDKLEGANKNVALGLKVANQNLIDRVDFFQTYRAEKGHLNGAEQEWKRYLNANPIFDPTKPKGTYDLNENRKTWQEWFATGGDQGQPRKSGAQRQFDAMRGKQATRTEAPQSAIDYLKRNNSPAVRKQFKQKYGYLPDG